MNKQLCLSWHEKQFKELNYYLELSGNKNKSFLELVDKALTLNLILDNNGPTKRACYRLEQKKFRALKNKADQLNLSISELIYLAMKN